MIRWLRQKIIGKSISAKLIAVNAVIITLSVLCLAVIISLINFRDTVNKEQQVMDIYLSNATNLLDNKLKDMARVSLMCFSDNRTQEILRENQQLDYLEKEDSEEYLQQLYTSLITIRNDIEGIYLFDKTSLVFRHDQYSSSIKTQYSMEKYIGWMREIIDTSANDISGCRLYMGQKPEFLWLNQTSDPFENHYIYLMREVKSFSPHELIGYILLLAPVSSFREVFEDLAYKQLSVYLVNDSGQVVCSQNGRAIGQNLKDIMPEWKVGDDAAGKTFQIQTETGKSLVSSRKSDYSGLTLVIERPLAYVYTDAKQFISLVAVLSFGLLVLLTILSGKITSVMIRPIRRLSRSMIGFNRENTRIYLPVQSDDEVGQLTSAFNTMMDTINNLIISEYEKTIALHSVELQQKEMQLLFLRNQINPHFLYNTLDTIRIKAALNGDQDVSDMIMLLVEFFRLSIRIDHGLVPIRDEIRHIQVYVRLMKYRYHDLTDCYSIDDSLNDILIPSFILQPILENSLFHGLKSVKYSGQLTVSVEADASSPEDILITIKDNGLGLSGEDHKHLNQILNQTVWESLHGEDGKKSHIGIANVQQRIRMFYPSDCGLTYFDNSDTGVAAQIRLKRHIQPPPEGQGSKESI